DFVTPEYSTKGDPNRKWESTRGIGTSFGFNRLESDETYLAPDELIRMFVDIVAHGGNLLLNVGPTGDGVIPFAQAQRLLALGWWLRTNGEAIYGTRPWVRQVGKTGEGHEVRYTHSPDEGALNAIVLDTPTSDVVELDVTPPPGADVRMLGHAEAPLAWEATSSGCRVTLTGQPAPGPTLALRITPPP